MRLKRFVVFLVLLAIVLAGLATRTATRDRFESPYFKGTSAMVYAHALAASEGTPLDTVSIKANFPDGYVPARYRADGFEKAWAGVFRAARFVSEVDGRDFARRTTMFLGALCALTMYALARRLWESQTSGLLAAFLVAFLAPFVLATNGRAFTHTTLAPFFVTAHAALALATLAAATRRGVLVRAIGTAFLALVLAVSWEPGPYLVAIWSVWVALTTRDETRRARLPLLVGHAIALLVACAASPHLVASRALGSWATTLVVASAVIHLLPRVLSPRHRAAEAAGAPSWRHPRLRGATILLATASVLWVVMFPVRASATEQFPAFSYLAARALHLFGKPDIPLALSDWMRHVWSLDHAPLPPHTSIEVFLPLGLLAVAFALCADLRARRSVFIGASVVAILSAIATLVDRSALPVSLPAMIVVMAGAARAPSKRRSPLVVVAVLVAMMAVVLRGGSLDASYQIAKAAGVANRDPSSFLWVSFENTDRELVRFVATRTSVKDAFLAPDDLSALLHAFTGRTVVALPGSTSKVPAERHVAMTRAQYGTEEELYEACRTSHIDFVVYSIDELLDTGRYSPRYLAGATTIEPGSIAYRMHFEPESLRRFTLQYENDHYRLYAVTGSPQPIFATDHPPFYQTDLLAKANRNVEAFRQLAVDVMLTYSEAVKARAHHNAEGARRRLEWCLLQAPRYSQARLALADALMDLNRYDDARRVVAALLDYAPDNTRGLYYAAYISAQLGKPEEAKSYLTLLLSIERDPQLIERAKVLQQGIEQGVPLRKGAPLSG